MSVPPPAVDLVVPTVGRPSLVDLLADLTREDEMPAASITVVDDRADPRPDELHEVTRRSAGGRCASLRVLATGGRGPAAARNAGWEAGRAPWVVFLDDDVRLRPGWGAALAQDLAAADGGGVVGAVRGRLRVPLPGDRPPTDWERQVGGLAGAPGWLTADLAVRRSVLEQIGGLDERFPRAYREDTDLELRVRAAGWTGIVGRRAVDHPVGPADRWTSLRRQRGNADDVLLARLHGRDWRDRVGEAPGTFWRHAVTTTAGGIAVAALAARRPRAAAAAGAAWAALTARFAWRRIAPGPRDRSEVATMVATSIAIPPAAVYHRLSGHRRWRHITPPHPLPPRGLRARRVRWGR